MSHRNEIPRRDFLMSSGLSVTGLCGLSLSGCNASNQTRHQNSDQENQKADKQESGTQTDVKTSFMPDYKSTGVQLLDSTPLADGFFYPGEWEKHEYTIMIMPSSQNWVGYGFTLRDVHEQWANVANALADFESVLMVVRPEDRKAAAAHLNSEIELIEFPVEDGWARDSGPTFVVNEAGERRVAGIAFNGWGEKFPPYSADALVKAHLCKHLDFPMYPIDLVGEGGAFIFDGNGTVITTEQCIMNSNRNPGLSREELTNRINQAFGTEKVIWMNKGLSPDPITDGHADGIAAFVDEGVVLLHSCEFRDDPNYAICRDARRALQEATDARGRKLEVVDLPLMEEGGHMNFYIGNGCVIVPIAGKSEYDDEPMGIIRELFDDREVIGIGGEVLAEGGGGIHCITQQVPAV